MSTNTKAYMDGTVSINNLLTAQSGVTEREARGRAR